MSDHHMAQLIKEYVWTRDKGICRLCGKPVQNGRGYVRRIYWHYYMTPLGRLIEQCWPTYHPVNLVLVCEDCHRAYKRKIPKSLKEMLFARNYEVYRDCPVPPRVAAWIKRHEVKKDDRLE